MASEVQQRAPGWIGNGQCLPAQVWGELPASGLDLQNCEAVFRILACLPHRAIPAGEWSWVFSWKEEQKMRRISPRDPSPGLKPPRGLAHQISPLGQIFVLKGETLGLEPCWLLGCIPL